MSVCLYWTKILEKKFHISKSIIDRSLKITISVSLHLKIPRIIVQNDKFWVFFGL